MQIELPICIDAKEFFTRWISSTIQTRDWSSWKNNCSDWKKRYGALEGKDFTNRKFLSHYQFVDALSDLVPENRLIVTGSSGLAVEAFYSTFRNKPGQRIFLTSGLGSMGYGLPAAVGACFGGGRCPTVCVESDGSLMLNLQELATVSASKLPLLLIVMNNQGYASIRNTQRNYFKSRFVGTGPEANMFMPDFQSLGSTFGFAVRRATTVSELIDTLHTSLAENGPTLLEVVLEPDEVLSPKVSALPQRDGSIISMPLEDMSPLLSLETLQREMIVPLTEQSLNAQR
jgi:acetolactate synthase-1/2/3 large subunit